jgi:hypothetical protein
VQVSSSRRNPISTYVSNFESSYLYLFAVEELPQFSAITSVIHQSSGESSWLVEETVQPRCDSLIEYLCVIASVLHPSFLLKLFNKFARLLFANEYLDSSEAGDEHPKELDSSSADLKD